MSTTFQGLGVALATPFNDGQNLDIDGLKKLVKHLVDGGVDFLVPLGSTGEAATLNDMERDTIVEVVLENSGGKPVVVGTGSNNTAQAAAWTRRAQQLGADGALVVTPFYNKPTPEGLVAHYEAVAEAAPNLPIILYNVPGRTGLNVTPTVLNRLWKNPAIVAVKESSGNVQQIAEIARTLPAGKALLSGDDILALPSIAVGAQGLISVLGNAAPRETKILVDTAMNGDRAKALEWNKKLIPLIDALFVESNPIPLKGLLKHIGICGDKLRLPLVTVSDSLRTQTNSLYDAVALQIVSV